MRSTPLALVVALVVTVGQPALADSTDGLYLLASEHTSPVPAALATHTPQGPRYVVPGARLPSPEVFISAQDNANTTFAVGVQYAHPPGVTTGDQCTRAILRFGRETLVSHGWGGDSDSCDTSFIVDAATASRIATALHVTRLDRHPIGENVVGTFATVRRSYRVGEPIEVVLTMDNPAGSPSVAWVRGGANRGPRDDQFDFTITRDGRQVARLEAMNFGGLSQMDELAPGARDEARAFLAPWADLSQPGHYEVRCSFRTMFSPAGVDPYDTTTGRAEHWDRTFTGTIRFDVTR
ncbi:MAG: hypothetical protein J0L92_00935 [Deltaproteobacteria bacterium]|nr:hypothetical protein [Deltaproteobacteria bacterium]